MSSELVVVVVDGRFYEKQDVFGQGDPYVVVKFGDQKAVTDVYHNTKKATFNQTFRFAYGGDDGASILFELWDSDTKIVGDSDDFVGGGAIGDLSQFKNNHAAVNLKLKDKKGKETGETNVEIEWVSPEPSIEDKGYEAPPDTSVEVSDEPSTETPPETSVEVAEPPTETIPDPVAEDAVSNQARLDARKKAQEQNKADVERALRAVTNDVIKVKIIDGQFYEKQDVFGQGDPYVTVAFGGRKFSTEVYHNTKKATFNEEFYFPFNGRDGPINFEIWDEDATFKADNDDLVGSAKIESLESYKDNKQPVNLKLKNDKGEETGELNLEIEWEVVTDEAKVVHVEIPRKTVKGLVVNVIDAKFYEKQDIFGQGDPYVTVLFNNQKYKTKVFHNTKTATFNEEISIPFDGSYKDSITFQLWDEDSTLKVDNDDLVGSSILNDIEQYKTKKGVLHLILKDGKGKDTGELNAELSWDLQDEGIKAIYDGPARGGKWVGKGKYQFPLGDVYEGDFINSKFDGEGKYTYRSGAVYEGDFLDDKHHGQGRYTFPNGNIYEGPFVNDKILGTGKLTYSSGAVYEGPFKNNKRNGSGKFTSANGDVYEGPYVDDRRQGVGKLVYKSGSVYEGTFVDDLPDGSGKLTYSTGGVYEGEFKAGKRNGQGVYTTVNGDIYEGPYVNDKREGVGKIKFNDGSLYEGDFTQNKREGKGKYTSPKGEIYEGDFLNDNFEGQGKYTYEDGRVYEGPFTNGYKHGNGTITLTDGTVQNVEYNLNKKVV